jgi:hypothetical protein
VSCRVVSYRICPLHHAPPMSCRSLAGWSSVSHALLARIQADRQKHTDRCCTQNNADGAWLVDAFPINGTLPPCLPACLPALSVAGWVGLLGLGAFGWGVGELGLLLLADRSKWWYGYGTLLTGLLLGSAQPAS